MNVEGFQADILAEPEALVRVAEAYGAGGLARGSTAGACC